MITSPSLAPPRAERGSWRDLECPHCHRVGGSETIDTRDKKDYVRRRRQCLACHARFTTYEVVIDPTVFETQRERAKSIAAELRSMAAALEVW